MKMISVVIPFILTLVAGAGSPASANFISNSEKSRSDLRQLGQWGSSVSGSPGSFANTQSLSILLQQTRAVQTAAVTYPHAGLDLAAISQIVTYLEQSLDVSDGLMSGVPLQVLSQIVHFMSLEVQKFRAYSVSIQQGQQPQQPMYSPTYHTGGQGYSGYPQDYHIHHQVDGNSGDSNSNLLWIYYLMSQSHKDKDTPTVTEGQACSDAFTDGDVSSSEARAMRGRVLHVDGKCGDDKVVDTTASCESASCDFDHGSADIATCCVDP